MSIVDKANSGNDIIHTYKHTYTDIHVGTYTHIYACINTYVHPSIHIYTHTHTCHTNIHTKTYTHMKSVVPKEAQSSPRCCGGMVYEV